MSASPRERAPDVKFCGLTRADDAAEGARFGARYLGVIFAGGPRLVSPARAAAILSAGRASGTLAGHTMPRCVGVMGVQSPDEIAAIVDGAGLDIVQLHADPTPAAVARVREATDREVWAALRVDGPMLPGGAAELFAAADAVVLDAKVGAQLGGNGVPLDWRALADAVDAARGGTRLVVAGGLTPANVKEAAETLGADVVDVSSGVEEAPGRKDHQLMRAFAAGAATAVTRGRGGREQAS